MGFLEKNIQPFDNKTKQIIDRNMFYVFNIVLMQFYDHVFLWRKKKNYMDKSIDKSKGSVEISTCSIEGQHCIMSKSQADK